VVGSSEKDGIEQQKCTFTLSLGVESHSVVFIAGEPEFDFPSAHRILGNPPYPEYTMTPYLDRAVRADWKPHADDQST